MLFATCVAVVFQHRRHSTGPLVFATLSFMFYAIADYRLFLFATLFPLLAFLLSNKKSPAWTLPFIAISYLFSTKYLPHVSWWGHLPDIFVPLGISFLTFQSISLHVERRKGFDLSLVETYAYLLYFPSVVSGPLSNPRTIISDMKTPREIQLVDDGARIITGFFYKLALSSPLAGFADPVFATPDAYSSSTLLLASVAYSCQIFFDFAGYSLMAIGISGLFGIRLPDNFADPYLSGNIREFWKKWHISLSSFLRDNLYIGLLGGNRLGKFRTAANAILTMTICGIWHGYGFSFVVWGLLHGCAVAIDGLLPTNLKLPRALGVFLTFIFVTFCWIFFRASDLDTATTFIVGIFTQPDGETFRNSDMLVVSISCAFVVIGDRLRTAFQSALTATPFYARPIFTGMALAFIIAISPEGLPNFIYFSF